MTFDDLKQIKSEAERVSSLYKLFNEDARLNHSKAARVEFLTNVHIIERYLKVGSKIMDIGAGAGEYSLYFAEKGYDVTAVELAEENIKAFRAKLRPELAVGLHQGNACDLSAFCDDSFDVVLVFGPLYHLEKREDRSKCISEAKRVCKKGGVIFFAFISNDMVILTESFCYDANYFTGDTYDHNSFKVKDFPFVFFTVEVARKMILDEKIQILTEVASDGVSELLADKINTMSDKNYEQYLKYHIYCCEKPEMLGRSNHILFAGKK
ncbi:MAG: class I SAM-dependent methyltransferase [Defluviitaleaceae bacterium]|nr:class I SAM-dependent methyltransferase [Defluviitaleaceae bacterium]